MRGLMMAAIAGLAAATQPVAATEWMYCNDASSTVTVGLLLGEAGVLSIAGVILSNGDHVWASAVAYGPGDEVSVGQGFEDEHMLAVDLMDKDFALLAQLRLMKAQEGTEPTVLAGTLRMPGQGAWPISCDAP